MRELALEVGESKQKFSEVLHRLSGHLEALKSLRDCYKDSGLVAEGVSCAVVSAL